MTKYIAWLTSILVLIVAAMSFALSYHALQGMAATYGLPGWLSYLWPLLIDFSLIVFSLCVVTAHLYSEATWRQWSLVGLSTIATCAYNYLHAPMNLIAQTIAIVPPVMLFFSFELLMMQLKNSIKRRELSATATQLAEVVDTYNQKLADVTAQIDTTATQVDTLTQQTQKVTDDTITGRRDQLAQLIHNAQAEGIKLTQQQMSEQLGVSLTTVRGDIKVLNGRVK